MRWQMRRMQAAHRWGTVAESIPAVIGNAMPKSGSHLIIQVLQGLQSLGPFVNPGFPPLNRSEDNQKLDDVMVLKNIQRLRSGDIAYAYLQARVPFIACFNRSPDGFTSSNSRFSVHTQKQSVNTLMVFVYRDPRDFVISHVFYATQMHPGHGLHRYYTETLTSMEERINAAIQGVAENEDVTDSPLSSVYTKYEKYLDWLSQPEVLCLKFEDLILQREKTLGTLLNFLAEYGFSPNVSHSEAVHTLAQAIVPKASGTFRRAKPGNWVEYFTESNKKIFKQNSADLLLRLGYEQNENW